MTRQEAIQLLSILKAAYPNSYKGMTKDEANGTINIWATQFNNMPYNVVIIAVNKLISTNTFPPSIGEVKEKIRGLYWEAWQMLKSHEDATEGIKWTNDPDEEPTYYGTRLDDKTLAQVKEILRVCEPMRTQRQIEPSLADLLQGYNAYLTDGSNDKKQISGGA